MRGMMRCRNSMNSNLQTDVKHKVGGKGDGTGRGDNENNGSDDVDEDLIVLVRACASTYEGSEPFIVKF